MAKVKSFKAEYGLSIQIKDNWHKFSCSLETEIEPNDDIKRVKEMTWNTVIVEIEKQVKEVLDQK